MPRGTCKHVAEFSQSTCCSLLWVADAMLGTDCAWYESRGVGEKWGGMPAGRGGGHGPETLLARCFQAFLERERKKKIERKCFKNRILNAVQVEDMTLQPPHFLLFLLCLGTVLGSFHEVSHSICTSTL